MKLILATLLVFGLSVGGDVVKTKAIESNTNINELQNFINSLGIQASSIKNEKARDAWMHIEQIMKESREPGRDIEEKANISIKLKESFKKIVELVVGLEKTPTTESSNKEQGKGCVIVSMNGGTINGGRFILGGRKRCVIMNGGTINGGHFIFDERK